MSESQGIIFETIVIVLKFGKLFQSKNVDINEFNKLITEIGIII
jgi:hypothetical protein